MFLPRQCDHLLIGVDADDITPHFRNLRGELADAAAEIDDALTRARRQQLDQPGAEFGDEAEGLVIKSYIPTLTACGVVFRPVVASPCASICSNGPAWC